MRVWKLTYLIYRKPYSQLDESQNGFSEWWRTTIFLLSFEMSAFGDRGAVAIRNLSFSIQAGEIMGIAGVDGNGQKEMAEAIAGQRRISDGQITIANVDITNRGASAAARRAWPTLLSLCQTGLQMRRSVAKCVNIMV